MLVQGVFKRFEGQAQHLVILNMLYIYNLYTLFGQNQTYSLFSIPYSDNFLNYIKCFGHYISKINSDNAQIWIVTLQSLLNINVNMMKCNEYYSDSSCQTLSFDYLTISHSVAAYFWPLIKDFQQQKAVLVVHSLELAQS